MTSRLLASRALRIVIVAVLAAAAGVALFVLGRSTADDAPARRGGYQQGHIDGYLAGLRDGAEQGREEGRSAQAVEQLPADERAPAQAAFHAGYVAGEDDVFAGYDGGWGPGTPYLITVAPGRGGATYRIATRTELQPGTAYFVCPGGGPPRVCSAAR